MCPYSQYVHTCSQIILRSSSHRYNRTPYRSGNKSSSARWIVSSTPTCWYRGQVICFNVWRSTPRSRPDVLKCWLRRQYLVRFGQYWTARYHKALSSTQFCFYALSLFCPRFTGIVCLCIFALVAPLSVHVPERRFTPLKFVHELCTLN